MQTHLVRRFKTAIRQRPVIGTFAKTSDPAFIEILGHAGFDFVILDLEHGPNTRQQTQHLIRAAQLVNILPVIRTADRRPEAIGQALDIGAGGVQIPQVTTPEEAEAVVAAAKFAPAGQRGVCRFVRAADYSCAPRERYFREANQNLVILQLEGAEAIANAEAIAAVPHLDIVFIGPYDLSQSLGLTGQIEHPHVLAAMKRLAAILARQRIAVGTFVEDANQARRWISLGLKYICYSVDVGIFAEAGRRIIADLTAKK